MSTISQNLKSPERCDRYRARLEAHLATLPDDRARRSFLDRESAKWADLFESWKRDVDKGVYCGEATAFEFHITMTDIDTRRIKYGAAVFS